MHQQLMHIVGGLLALGVLGLFLEFVSRTGKNAKKRAAEEAEARRPFDQHIVCPHCHTQGSVQTRHGQQKQGISGAKATGAVLTGGVSLLAVGLSRKQDGVNATCHRCGMAWFV